MLSRRDPGNHDVLDGIQVAHWNGQFLYGKGMPRHARQLTTRWRELCKNGWTDRNAVCDMDSGRPKKACIRRGFISSRRSGNF